MSAHNASAYLELAIESILQQTFTDFEFIIIDDGSVDQTAEIIARYAAKDARIQFVRNGQNLGLANSLNIGLEMARGKYIARMDADDISLPQRFAHQVAFMDANPEIGICGTWAELFGISKGIFNPPLTNGELKSLHLWRCGFVHPTVMMRRQVVMTHHLRYDPTYPVAEDFALWVAAAPYTNFANMSEVLLRYRAHDQQSSKLKKERQLYDTKKLSELQLQKLNIEATPEDSQLHFELFGNLKLKDKGFIEKAESWIRTLFEHNNKYLVFPEPEFSKMLATRWYVLCRLNVHLGMFAWFTYMKSPVSRFAGVSKLKLAKFFVLALLPWLNSQ